MTQPAGDILPVTFYVERDGGKIAENINVIQTGSDVGIVDNSPFYAYGVSFKDVINFARDPDGRATFLNVSKPGGHSCYRVRIPGMEAEKVMNERWGPFSEQGCTYEGSSVNPGYYLVSVDVPPAANVDKVYQLLEGGLRDRIWDFEEANFEHA